MFRYRGNTANEWLSDSKNLPTSIDNFAIVNKTSGTIGVNVYAFVGNEQSYSIAPHNLQLDAGEMYESDRHIVLLASERIKVKVSGSADYDFTMSNINPPTV
jgi:hypothetical protein